MAESSCPACDYVRQTIAYEREGDVAFVCMERGGIRRVEATAVDGVLLCRAVTEEEVRAEIEEASKDADTDVHLTDGEAEANRKALIEQYRQEYLDFHAELGREPLDWADHLRSWGLQARQAYRLFWSPEMVARGRTFWSPDLVALVEKIEGGEWEGEEEP